MVKKFIIPDPIHGLKGLAGFKINEWLKTHPASKETLDKCKHDIIRHIKSFYERGYTPVYQDWYVGMTTKSNLRQTAHKRERKLKELVRYGKFYVYSMSNARALESSLFVEYGMGNTDRLGGIGKNSTYVYVFHARQAQLNGLI